MMSAILAARRLVAVDPVEVEVRVGPLRLQAAGGVPARWILSSSPSSSFDRRGGYCSGEPVDRRTVRHECDAAMPFRMIDGPDPAPWRPIIAGAWARYVLSAPAS
jgi:hypothetical protein